MTNKRMSRVDAEIQKTLASIISKFDDIDFATSLISVMKVETTSDFSFAKVFVSVLGEKEKKTRIVKKLNDNKKTIRYDLAHNLKMRNVPELMFVVDEVEETKRLQNLIPNTVSGNRNAGDLTFSMNSVGFAFINYQVREDVARKIDSYFDMFGYRVNEIKTPNTKTRSKWNFLQTNVCNITGDIPQEALMELKNMYNAGITIWHDPAHFLDYDQTNSIV